MKNILKIYILFLIAFNFSIAAQDLNQDFLDSLPPEIAEDVMARAETRAEAEEAYYRPPSTFIEKPIGEDERFGAKVFSLMQTTLMPINDPNLDDSYTLDYGDQLRIQYTGQKTSISELTIGRDGSINIDEIGKIHLAGLSLNEAVKIIKNSVNQAFIGVDTFVSLINIRDIQVVLAGNVYNPGPYTLNGNSNIFHALVISGGPSETGSFRSINLIRNSEVIESLDLYDTFIYGKSSFKTRLKTGDVVFINPVSNNVFISGGVKRPGQYELLDGENLFNLVEFSNGLNAYADKSNIVLERILDGRIKSIPIVNVSQFKKIESKDGDRIFIREYSFRLVEINGAVNNPGTYLMNEGDTINDAINKAGGFTENAYAFGGIYESSVAEEINEKAIESLYDDYIENIMQASQESSVEIDIEAYIAIATQLRESPPNGRIVADFINLSKNPIYLNDGDEITIPEITNQVYVYGEVFAEGAVEYSADENIDYYISRKGGTNELADIRNIYILQPNGETFKYKSNTNIFQNQIQKTEIYPGSIIFVPQKLENKAAQRLAAQSYAAILGSIGVSLASLSVLKNN
jgi:polysaccharide export outer membrane protein